MSLKQLKMFLGRSFFVRSFYYVVMWFLKYPSFLKDIIKFKRLAKKQSRKENEIKNLFPCLFDNTKTTSFDPHYTYHPAWAARIVKRINPKKHIDVSSILHFSTLLSAFIPTEFYDFRPAEVRLDGLACKEGDLTNLPFESESVESISCMHTIEHVGLGRYGDTIDPDGDLKAANELQRVVKKGGSLIFVSPIGRPRLEFNAHRVYSYEQVMNMFPSMKLKEFALIPDDFREKGLLINPEKMITNSQEWGCGCFWFTKK